ncbi:MAG: FKBP-type peptidyl-prolyl cis-trans isomerase [Candidatus Saccharibacteria bacterium]|nr:FKBP-type peptidyl-prolyl cis-trans isomerase [Candidatus Saccharibacteria bacterium]
MEEKELKTSLKQRIIISIIAILMLGSTLAAYAIIVISGSKNAETSAQNSEEVAKLQEEFDKKGKELSAEMDEISKKYYEEFKGYKDRVRSYNAAAVNEARLKYEDLKKGDGTEITTEFNDYYAFYIGFCADEKVFDSSFSPNYDNPTSLKEPLSGQMGLIAGWTEGVQGMKLGGVREIAISSELGYGETDSADNACGKGQPMKFVVMAIEPGEKYRKLYEEYGVIYYQMMAAQNAK